MPEAQQSQETELSTRTAKVDRETGETQVSVELDLDGKGSYEIETGNGMFDHLLAQLSRHGLIDLKLSARGDVEVGWHHLVEDTAIVLGRALQEAVGDGAGITRMASFYVPLDEALVQAVVDVSGRPYCVHTGEPAGQEYVQLGGSGVSYLGSLTRHVFETIAFHGHLALHVRVLAGREPHHIVETQFKAVARAFRDAIALDPRETGVPSTKGAL